MLLLFRRMEPRLIRFAAFLLFEILMGAGYISSISHAAVRFPGLVIFAAFAYSYLLTSSIAVVMYMVFETVRNHLDAATNQSRRRALNAAGSALVAAPFAAMGYGALIERTRFEVRQVEVLLDRLPADLEGLRILHLSDIHLGVFLSERELARVIDTSR